MPTQPSCLSSTSRDPVTNPVLHSLQRTLRSAYYISGVKEGCSIWLRVWSHRLGGCLYVHIKPVSRLSIRRQKCLVPPVLELQGVPEFRSPQGTHDAAIVGGQGVCWIRQSSTLSLLLPEFRCCLPSPIVFPGVPLPLRTRLLAVVLGSSSRQHEVISVFDSFLYLDIVYCLLKDLENVALSSLYDFSSHSMAWSPCGGYPSPCLSPTIPCPLMTVLSPDPW